jgi:hypothetical protein
MKKNKLCCDILLKDISKLINTESIKHYEYNNKNHYKEVKPHDEVSLCLLHVVLLGIEADKKGEA